MGVVGLWGWVDRYLEVMMCLGWREGKGVERVVGGRGCRVVWDLLTGLRSGEVSTAGDLGEVIQMSIDIGLGLGLGYSPNDRWEVDPYSTPSIHIVYSNR